MHLERLAVAGLVYTILSQVFMQDKVISIPLLSSIVRHSVRQFILFIRRRVMRP